VIGSHSVKVLAILGGHTLCETHPEKFSAIDRID
jgi:hypothetical protein